MQERCEQKPSFFHEVRNFANIVCGENVQSVGYRVERIDEVNFCTIFLVRSDTFVHCLKNGSEKESFERQIRAGECLGETFPTLRFGFQTITDSGIREIATTEGNITLGIKPRI